MKIMPTQRDQTGTSVPQESLKAEHQGPVYNVIQDGA
jgi:hypothetical protein